MNDDSRPGDRGNLARKPTRRRLTAPEPPAQSRLLYLLEGEIGLDPELSKCNQCSRVEYIYFTGIVCHLGSPRIGQSGKCLDFQPDK